MAQPLIWIVGGLGGSLSKVIQVYSLLLVYLILDISQ
jgi:hypothetical protein